MKNFSGLLIVLALAILFAYEASCERQRLKMEVLLLTKQQSLLEDQCRDYEYKLSNTRRYEDGYRDALIKVSVPNAGTFDEGYEAAKLVYGKGTYTEGYHNAIAQFGCTFKPPKNEIEQKDEFASKESN